MERDLSVADHIRTNTNRDFFNTQIRSSKLGATTHFDSTLWYVFEATP